MGQVFVWRPAAPLQSLNDMCACTRTAMFGLLTSSFLALAVPAALLRLPHLLPQGSRQEVGSRSEAIVKGKPLASSCYERKCIQMCFLCVHPLSPLPPPSCLFSLPRTRAAKNRPLCPLLFCLSFFPPFLRLFFLRKIKVIVMHRHKCIHAC